MLPSKKPVSLITTASAASRSLFSRSQSSSPTDECSSSPSNRKRRLTGSRPRVAKIASAALRCMCSWPLSSAAPRPDDAPVANERLERGRLPQLDRVDRLDVVVAVHEDRRGALGVEPVRVDDRVAPRRRDVDMLEADPAPARRRSTRPRGECPARAPTASRSTGSAAARSTTRGGRPSWTPGTPRPPGRWRPGPAAAWCSCRDGSRPESKRPADGRALMHGCSTGWSASVAGETLRPGFGAGEDFGLAPGFAQEPATRSAPPADGGAAAGRGGLPSAGGR